MAPQLDPSALQLMGVVSEVMTMRNVVRRQRSVIWGLMTVLRAERRTNAELLSLLDAMLSNEFGGG